MVAWHPQLLLSTLLPDPVKSTPLDRYLNSCGGNMREDFPVCEGMRWA